MFLWKHICALVLYKRDDETLHFIVINNKSQMSFGESIILFLYDFYAFYVSSKSQEPLFSAGIFQLFKVTWLVLVKVGLGIVLIPNTYILYTTEFVYQ